MVSATLSSTPHSDQYKEKSALCDHVRKVHSTARDLFVDTNLRLQVCSWRDQSNSHPVMALWWCAKVARSLPTAWFSLLLSSLLWQMVKLHWNRKCLEAHLSSEFLHLPDITPWISSFKLPPDHSCPHRPILPPELQLSKCQRGPLYVQTPHQHTKNSS